MSLARVFPTYGRNGLLAAFAAAAAMLVAPAAASAANTYANASTGNDTNDCLTAGAACLTITEAINKAGAGDTIFVADGTYTETLFLDNDKSLLALDSTDPRPIIDSGPGVFSDALVIGSSGAGTVSGFRIRSEEQPLDVGGAATIEDNIFDDPAEPQNGSSVRIQTPDPVLFTDNTIVDPSPNPADYHVGIIAISLTGTEISDNTFTDVTAGVMTGYGDTLISNNTFTGMRPLQVAAPFSSAAIIAMGGFPTITANTISARAGGAGSVAGIYVASFAALGSGAPPAGATLSRNRVTSYDVGVQVVDTELPVTMSNDLIYDNGTGLSTQDSSSDSPPSTHGDVTATNETIYDNGFDVSLSYTTLTLNSSLIGNRIRLPTGDHGECLISNSRGASNSVANGCSDFVTNADPQLVDPGTGNYRLQATSPLIDLGNPTNPGAGVVDFYGTARALQGKACSTVRRDIGAAEYNPGTTPACVPVVTPPQTPQPQVTDQAPSAPTVLRQLTRRGKKTSVSFNFLVSMDGVSFRCRLDRKNYRPCRSPKSYRNVLPGKHRFQVFAVSPGGTGGPSHADQVQGQPAPSVVAVLSATRRASGAHPLK